MRGIFIGLGAIAAIGGVAAGALLFWPISGPARNLDLTGDAERGSYLIRVGGCVSCHTNGADGALLAGGAPLETQFGTFVAPNITPDAEHGIGAWDLETFARAMSDGISPQGHLYPVFPYEHYTLMPDQDIADLYAALMEIEPVAAPAGDSEVAFPFNMRPLLGAWKTLFFRPERFTGDQSDPLERGRYLAYGPAHCVACHTPRNALGALEWDAAFTGSPGGPGGRAPAITAAALAEDGYDVPTLVQTLKDGFTPGFDVLGGPMGEVITEGTSHWSDEDLEALAGYLLAE
ncbi:diheme cytochrome c-type [Devosia pacifica]|uniref:Diheme cytochrome c-type n=1 Tax=Devosia pacifica TaxID=1335967 RepID=A0A918S8A4_9HYPH|nr:cytochrome c [Devosia pacifica]GHA26849.1 diheme cytochrome c-type [Devosia pacifica]